MLVLVFGSDPGLVSPFFHDELLALVLPFVSVRRQRERGLGGKSIVPWEKQGVNLFQRFNMDSDNAMELDCNVDLN